MIKENVSAKTQRRMHADTKELSMKRMRHHEERQATQALTESSRGDRCSASATAAEVRKDRRQKSLATRRHQKREC